MVRIFLTYKGRNGCAEVEAREAAEREEYEIASSSPMERPSKRLKSSLKKKGKQRAVPTPSYHDPHDDLEADLMEALETPPATPYSRNHNQDDDETGAGEQRDIVHDFTVYVDDKPVYTNRAELSRLSPVFAYSLENIPPEEGLLNLEESPMEGVTQITMEVFALWIDTSRIKVENVLRNHKIKVVRFEDDGTPSPSRPMIDPHYDLLIDAYFLGETIKCISFQNAIMNALISHFRTKYEKSHRLPLNNTNRINQDVLPSSPLRKFLVDLLHFWLDGEELKKNVEKGWIPTAILISIAQDAMAGEEAKQKCPAPWELERKEYHVWESEEMSE